jgi:hypothetical protein
MPIIKSRTVYEVGGLTFTTKEKAIDNCENEVHKLATEIINIVDGRTKHSIQLTEFLLANKKRITDLINIELDNDIEE